MLWVSPIDCSLFDCLLTCCSIFSYPILLCQFIAEFLAWILMVESPCFFGSIPTSFRLQPSSFRGFFHVFSFFYDSLDWFKGKIYRKPWFLPSNIGLSCKFSHHPILWMMLQSTLFDGSHCFTVSPGHPAPARGTARCPKHSCRKLSEALGAKSWSRLSEGSIKLRYLWFMI